VSEAERIAGVYREHARRRGGSRWDLRNRGNRAILAERRELTGRLLERQGWLPLADRRILEVGCGGGGELAYLLDLGASASRLAGVDLLPERIDAARQAFPELDFRVANADHLEFADRSFDLVLAITLFTSILDATMARNVASEVGRVLRPGGGLLWYDFRYDSPANRNVRGVGAARVRELFPGFQGELHTVTVIPPLARRLGPLTAGGYRLLASIPPMRSHLLGLLVKGDSNAI
jgi:SAM-dependent methyltransferase